MAGGREPHELIRALLEEEERERKERAVGEQQQKEGAARRQRGTRGTRASFGGVVAKLALVTPANIGALQSYPLKEISSRDLEGRYGGEVFLLYL